MSWRKSSYSGQGGECVEIADDHPDLVPVRHSKDPAGPALLFPRTPGAPSSPPSSTTSSTSSSPSPRPADPRPPVLLR
ncbi:DUF397 domain-containing protein [Streptomyces sp. TLI_053]|uniref:DUF397 domain-containing protein n=1 Tax=Streptomyces sp. TLI_053 TaxID=1855352 RepID=UPI000A514323